MNEKLIEKIDGLLPEEVVEEAKKYPTEDEAKNLLAWTMALEPLGMSMGTSPIVNKAFAKADKARMEVWDKIFGDKSPWKVVMKGSRGKRAVEWDKFKADQLGI